MTTIEQIKSKLDIADFIQEYIRLKKTGANYKALCPFHKEKTPSFVVSPEKQIWHCFGCGKGGDHFTFYMEMEGADFKEALEFLAKKTGVSIHDKRFGYRPQKKVVNGKVVDLSGVRIKDQLYKINQIVAKLFEFILWKKAIGKPVIKFLENKGFKQEVLREFQVGYVPNQWDLVLKFLRTKKFKDNEIKSSGLVVLSQGKNRIYDRFRNRIMFPIRDIQGRVVGFSGRIFTEDKQKQIAKYINTSNTLIYNKSNILFNLDKARAEIRSQDKCLILEGPKDVIASVQAEVKYVLAPCGTSLTENHLRLIKRYTRNVVFCFDGDMAGSSATDRAVEMALNEGLDVKVIKLPKDKDPEDIIMTNNVEWMDLATSAQEVLSYYFDIYFERFDKKTVEGKKNIAEKILPLIMRYKNPIERTENLQKLADRLNISEDVLLETYKTYKTQPGYLGKETKQNIELEDRESFLLKKLIAIYTQQSKNKDFRGKLENIAQTAPAGYSKLLLYTLDKGNGKISENDRSDLEQELVKIKAFELEDEEADKKMVFDKIYKELRSIINNNKKKNLQKEIQKAEKNGDSHKVEALFEELNKM